MSDDQTLEVENLDTTPEELEASATTETPETTEPTPGPTDAEKAGLEADAALKAEKDEGATETEETEAETPEFKPDYKFKASGKEHEVPEMFKALIKDEATDKEVKSLLSKAYGSDMLIERNKKFETANSTLTQENTNIKGSIDGLRQIYTDAVKRPEDGGNLLKLDQFFQKLNIPENVVLQYAVAKVQFQEMPPEQRNAIIAQMNAEKQAQVLNHEQSTLQGQNLEVSRRLKELELNQLLGTPDVQSIANDYDKRVGKPGSFRDAVIRTGELAWFRQKVDLPPDQAVNQVIEAYGLKPSASAPAAPSQAAGGNPGAGTTKPVVVRTDKVIPNVQGKGSQSPLKTKPRSIEDIKKLSERAQRGEAV